MKLYFFIALVAFCKSSFAQINVISQSVTNPDSNILFVGVDNYIKVSGIKDYKIISNTSLLYKIGKDKYDIRVSNVRQSVLKLYVNKKLRFSKIFRIETLPLLKVQLGCIEDTIATVSKILADPYLHVILPKSNYKHNFKITEFSLVILKSNNDTISKMNIAEDYISKSQLNVIKDLKGKDVLLFYNIYGTCPDCRRIKFYPLKIIIN